VNKLLEKWEQLHGLYKIIAAVVIGTLIAASYHDRFVTHAQAAEQQRKARDEITLMRVDNKKAELRTLIEDKADAQEEGKVAKVSRLEGNIQTLRDDIKSLCDQVAGCK
jgi:hypothetical protein